MPYSKAILILDEQSAYFERAAAFIGRPRERFVALTEADRLCILLHPSHYRSLQFISMAAQPGVAGERYRSALQRCERRLLWLLTDVIRDAISLEDLRMSDILSPDDLACTLWAVAFRTRTLMNLAIPEPRPGKDQDQQICSNAGSTLLDALGWKPLTRQWDYEQTRERVRNEVFAEEYKKVTGLKT